MKVTNFSGKRHVGDYCPFSLDADLKLSFFDSRYLDAWWYTLEFHLLCPYALASIISGTIMIIFGPYLTQRNFKRQKYA